MKPTTRNLCLALAVALPVLAVGAYGWEVPVDLRLLLRVVVLLVFAGSVVPSIVGFIRRADTEGWRAGVPLLINAIVLMIVIAGPLERLTIGLNFWAKYDKRMEVVALARAGKIKERVVLQETSNFGEQLDPSGASIRFKMTAGCMGECWSGFVYVFNDGPPTPEPEPAVFYQRKLQAHWFWVDVVQ